MEVAPLASADAATPLSAAPFEVPETPCVPPDDFNAAGSLALPKFLSPSRAGDFRNCPRRFFFSSVARLSAAATEATTVGTLAHFALEHLFEFPADRRVFDSISGLVAQHWEQLRNDAHYAAVASLPSERVAALLDTARTMVANYFAIEDPTALSPLSTEQRMYAMLAGVPTVGVIDRLDRATYSSGAERLVISDYKTGRVPRRDSRFLSDKFSAMRVYAALVEELTGERAFHLRLVYLAAGNREGVFQEVFDERSHSRTLKLWRSTWAAIGENAESGEWKPRPNPLCDWCDHKAICPAFSPLGAAPSAAPSAVAVSAPKASAAAPPSYSDDVFDLDTV